MRVVALVSALIAVVVLVQINPVDHLFFWCAHPNEALSERGTVKFSKNIKIEDDSPYEQSPTVTGFNSLHVIVINKILYYGGQNPVLARSEDVASRRPFRERKPKIGMNIGQNVSRNPPTDFCGRSKTAVDYDRFSFKPKTAFLVLKNRRSDSYRQISSHLSLAERPLLINNEFVRFNHNFDLFVVILKGSCNLAHLSCCPRSLRDRRLHILTLSFSTNGKPFSLCPQKNGGKHQDEREQSANQSSQRLDGIVFSSKDVFDASSVESNTDEQDVDAFFFTVKLLVLFCCLVILYAALERWSRGKND